MPLAADIRESFQRSLDELFAFVPNLLGAIAILVLGYLVARFVSASITPVLRGVKADQLVATGTLGDYKRRLLPGIKPSAVISTIAFWFVLGAALLLPVSALGIEALTSTIEGVVSYLPNLIATVLILVVATAIARAVRRLGRQVAEGTMLGRLVQTALPALVIAVAVFAALDQLKIAEDIVLWTYVLVLGSIALGFALAFGLAGRDLAAQIIGSAYESGRERAPQLREEARQATEHASSGAVRLEGEIRERGTDGEEADTGVIESAWRPDRGVQRSRAGETKPFFLTTEFVAVVLTVAALAIGAASADGFDSPLFWILTTVLACFYLLSRGFAKSGRSKE